MFVIQRYIRPSSPTQPGSSRVLRIHAVHRPVSPIRCLLHSLHQTQGMWVWETNRSGLCCLYTPQKRKSQPEACPGAPVSPTTHTHLHTPRSPRHTWSRFFKLSSILSSVCPSLPTHNSNLRRVIMSWSQPSQLHVSKDIRAPQPGSGSFIVCQRLEWAPCSGQGQADYILVS